MCHLCKHIINIARHSPGRKWKKNYTFDWWCECATSTSKDPTIQQLQNIESSTVNLPSKIENNSMTVILLQEIEVWAIKSHVLVCFEISFCSYLKSSRDTFTSQLQWASMDTTGNNFECFRDSQIFFGKNCYWLVV